MGFGHWLSLRCLYRSSDISSAEEGSQKWKVPSIFEWFHTASKSKRFKSLDVIVTVESIVTACETHVNWTEYPRGGFSAVAFELPKATLAREGPVQLAVSRSIPVDGRD